MTGPMYSFDPAGRETSAERREGTPPQQQLGGRVYRRRIVVVEDWAEVPHQISTAEDGA